MLVPMYNDPRQMRGLSAPEVGGAVAQVAAVGAAAALKTTTFKPAFTQFGETLGTSLINGIESDEELDFGDWKPLFDELYDPLLTGLDNKVGPYLGKKVVAYGLGIFAVGAFAGWMFARVRAGGRK